MSLFHRIAFQLLDFFIGFLLISIQVDVFYMLNNVEHSLNVALFHVLSWVSKFSSVIFVENFIFQY